MTPLESILRDKRKEIERRKATENPASLEKRIADAPPPADFRGAIHVEGRLSMIAEIKRRSPSRGKIADVEVADLARAYDDSPAAAISVLADSHFDGQPEHVAEVKSITGKPVLWKDFVLEIYQVYQARAYGADAALLIASILEKEKLAELLTACTRLGIAALVESHAAQDLAGIPDEATIYGINNRALDSADLAIDVNTTPTLLPLIPQGKTVVCESGIFTRQDVERIEALERVNAILVGTSVIGSGDPQKKIRELLGR